MPPSSIIPSSLEGNLQITSNVSTQTIDTKFGKPEDIIEAHVYNANKELLQSYPNIKNPQGINLNFSEATLINNPSNPPGS